jgi:hypothetical protein
MLVVDESPLVVPRRRRGAEPAASVVPLTGTTWNTRAASEVHRVATAGASNGNTAGDKNSHHILVDDATQSDPAPPPVLFGFPQRDIGDVTLIPPQSESPKFLKYLAETRAALSMMQGTLSRRRGGSRSSGPSQLHRNHNDQQVGFEERSSPETRRWSVSAASVDTPLTDQFYAGDGRVMGGAGGGDFVDETTPTDVVYVVKREGSPLGWQKRDTPSHTTFTTNVRHDDTDEDCVSDLSSGDDEVLAAGQLASSSLSPARRRALFSGGMRPPVW